MILDEFLNVIMESSPYTCCFEVFKQCIQIMILFWGIGQAVLMLSSSSTELEPRLKNAHLDWFHTTTCS